MEIKEVSGGIDVNIFEERVFEKNIMNKIDFFDFLRYTLN